MFIAILVVLIILFIIYFLYKRFYTNNSFFGKSGTSLFNTQNKQFADHQEVCDGSEEPIILPLIYDRRYGIYRTQIRLGTKEKQQTFSVIPDTGSSILIISSPECGDCNPKDGVFDPELGTPIQRIKGRIRYGGQQISDYYPYKSYLMNYTDKQGRVIPKEVEFGLVTQSKSSDNEPLQILGLQGEGPGFIQNLCNQNLLFDFNRGKLVIGVKNEDLNKYSDKSNEILQSLFDLHHPTTGPAYPMGKIKELRISGSNGVIKSKNYDYAIIDTGSTGTVFPGFNKLVSSSEPVTLEIDFETNGGSGSPKTVRFIVKPDLVADESMPVKNTILIGIKWLKDKVLYIDSDHDKVALV